jgi:hypothetical protein
VSEKSTRKAPDSRSSPGRHGIALFFDRNCSFALAILLKSDIICANQN